MSYYITTTSIDLTIPTKNLPAAAEMLTRLDVFAHHRHAVITAADLLALIGFDTETTPAGLALTGHSGKLGPQEEALAAIAHLITPGSYIEWHIDDGDPTPLRFEFDGHDLNLP